MPNRLTVPTPVAHLIRRTLAKAGYELRPLPTRITGGSLPHEQLSTRASYAPWRADPAFQVTHEIVRANTLVDVYRCYELWQLAAEAAKLPGGAALEVGVWRGGTAALLAKNFALAGVNDAVYACDTFKGVVGASAADNWYRGGEHADTSIKIVEELARKLDLSNLRILSGIFPQETGHLISGERFRFCHIDVDVYQSASDIVEWVWPRLVPGGMIVFDDYGMSFCEGITRLVDSYRDYPDRSTIYNLNGHAILVKLHSNSDGSDNTH